MSRRWALVIIATAVLGWLFERVHVPAAWILAAILASAAAALLTSRELPVNDHYYRFGRGIIGVLAALPLLSSSPATLAGYLIPGLALAGASLALCLGAGWVLARWEPTVSVQTGVLSMLPGGASMMPALAQELGADYRYVALSQYLRLVLVSVTLPGVAHLLSTPGGAQAATTGHVTWWAVIIIVAIALLGDAAGSLIHLPAPSVLGPMALTVLVGLWLPDDVSLTPPHLLQILAFTSIGWICGGGMSLPALRHFARQLPAIVAFIALLMGLCALAGWALSAWSGCTYFEAYLATSPGALETVLALGAAGGAGGVVVAFQIIRLVCVLLLAGWLPQLIGWVKRLRG